MKESGPDRVGGGEFDQIEAVPTEFGPSSAELGPGSAKRGVMSAKLQPDLRIGFPETDSGPRPKGLAIARLRYPHPCLPVCPGTLNRQIKYAVVVLVLQSPPEGVKRQLQLRGPAR